MRFQGSLQDAEAVLGAIFKLSGLEDERNATAYRRYYAKQVDLIALHDGAKYGSIKTHEDIINVINIISGNIGKADVLVNVRERLTGRTEEQHLGSINLAARLSTMIDFGQLPYAYSGGRSLDWDSGTLTEFISDYFAAVPRLGHDHVKLEKAFNAKTLESIAGLTIRWTDNLADHLRMMKDDTEVAIFHHVTFLQHHSRYARHSHRFPRRD